MAREAVIGLDIGTTSTKAILYDLSGCELATAQQVLNLLTPQPAWAEQDPDELWQSVITVLREVVGRADSNVVIKALSLASQCGSLLPAAEDGRPVYPIVTWIDTRAAAIVAGWLTDGTAETIRRVSGWHPQPGLSLATLAWLRQHSPERIDRAQHFFSANDYIIHCLSGQKVTDYSCANEMLFMDVTTGQWSEELCRLAGIVPSQLSRPGQSGTAVGPITPAVQRLTGLPAATLVVNGGHDHCAEALALGITQPGQLLLTCGTAWVITGVVGMPDIDTLPQAMDLNFHVVPNRWTVSQFLGGLGTAVEWWLNRGLQSVPGQPSLSRDQLYTALEHYLAQSQPGAGGLVYVSPTIVGKSQGGFAGLRLDHTRADLSRAILEGAAFELRLALDTLRKAGQPVDHLWLLGGATRSQHWPRLMADIIGIPISTTEYAHWAALGAGALAGSGAGLLAAEAAHKQYDIPMRTIEPDTGLSALYGERYESYQRAKSVLG